ncbi:MAG: HPr family phosphocarrier protein [Micrococcales bacterium]
MISGKVSVANIDGWHARPASEFARLVGQSPNRVRVSRQGMTPVPGDSVLSLISLGAKQGDVLIIEVEGPDSETLLNSLISLF